MSHRPPLWRQIQKESFTNWRDLADYLQLSQEQREQISRQSRFCLLLPRRLAAKMRKGTLEDPLLRQFLPHVCEEQSVPSFLEDPVGEQACRYANRLLKKYAGRALILCSQACAMHCRFCFRRHQGAGGEKHSYEEALECIAKDTSLREVLLSGGDPLSLEDGELKSLLERLAAIPHIRRLRFHSRFPIGIPQRLDESFFSMLSSIQKQIWFVIHSNHPAEWDDDLFSRLRKFWEVGIPVLNQSVLLRGVNDDVATLAELCEKLVDHGITPYYLHQLDRVSGAAHFEVSRERGMELMDALSKRLSGYALPRYVREIAGAPGKVSMATFSPRS